MAHDMRSSPNNRRTLLPVRTPSPPRHDLSAFSTFPPPSRGSLPASVKPASPSTIHPRSSPSATYYQKLLPSSPSAHEVSNKGSRSSSPRGPSRPRSHSQSPPASRLHRSSERGQTSKSPLRGCTPERSASEASFEQQRPASSGGRLRKETGKGRVWKGFAAERQLSETATPAGQESRAEDIRPGSANTEQRHSLIADLKHLLNRSGRFNTGSISEAAALLSSLSPFVEELPMSLRTALMRLLQLEIIPQGKVLQRQGEMSGEAFFLLLEGAFEVRVAGKAVAVLGPGTTFGEQAFMSPFQPHASSIVCQCDCSIFKLDKLSFLALFERRCHSAAADVMAYLATLPFFRLCSQAQLTRLAAAASAVVYKVGTVFAPDAMSGCSVLRRGQCWVSGQDTDSGQAARPASAPAGPRSGGASRAAVRRVHITNLGPGALFGLSALFPDLRRSWQVEACCTVETINFQKGEFLDILGEQLASRLHDEFAFKVHYYDGRHRNRAQHPIPLEPPLITAALAHGMSPEALLLTAAAAARPGTAPVSSQPQQSAPGSPSVWKSVAAGLGRGKVPMVLSLLAQKKGNLKPVSPTPTAWAAVEDPYASPFLDGGSQLPAPGGRAISRRKSREHETLAQGLLGPAWRLVLKQREKLKRAERQLNDRRRTEADGRRGALSLSWGGPNKKDCSAEDMPSRKTSSASLPPRS